MRVQASLAVALTQAALVEYEPLFLTHAVLALAQLVRVFPHVGG